MRLIFIRNYSNLLKILLLTLLFQSCKKSDQGFLEEKEFTSMERKFFFTNRTRDLTESKLVDFFIRQNRSKRFVEQTIKIIGFPKWEKMITIKSKSGISGRGASDSLLTTYLIPFVRDSQNYVNASLIISVYPSDTTFAYRSDWEYQYKTHGSPTVDSTAEAHAVFFMFLDKITFGYSEFYVTDTSLFPEAHAANLGAKKLTILNTSSQSGRGNTAGNGQDCLLWGNYVICPTPTSPTCSGPSGCDYLNCPGGVCWLYYGCVLWELSSTQIGGSGPIIGSGGGTSVGNGGATGGSSPSPCPGTTTYQRGQTATYGCGPGWSPSSTSPNHLTYLTTTLSLSSAQASFLLQNPYYQIAIYNYISQNYSSQSVQICKEHIDLLMSMPEYRNFVTNHDITGTQSLVWWMDENWLDNPLYFNLDITRATTQFKKLTFAEKALVIIYPTQAFLINLNVQVAFDMSDSRMGVATSTGLNDKKDAFRHAFFQAINTRDIPGSLLPVPLTGSAIVTLFATAHESEVPQQLQLEKEMDLFNNSVGISYCWNCWTTSNSSIADAIIFKLQNGDLKYLSPIWQADPNFLGINGSNNNYTATHGITTSTLLIPTNQ